MQNDPVAALVAKLEQAGFDPRPTDPARGNRVARRMTAAAATFP